VAKNRINKPAMWRSDWFAGLVVVVISLTVYTFSGFVSSLERRFYDVASTATNRQPSDRIAEIRRHLD